jgi:hypothetical protein
LFESAAGDVQTIVDAKDAAESTGLRYVSDARLGIKRRKSGKGFTYTRADGSRLTERDVLGRMKSLAVPPAWTDVSICPFADGHVQATGRDAKPSENVSARLGNTPTICRKCYVHPEILTSYLDRNLVLEIKSAVENELRDELGGLKPEEAAVLAMLRGRLARELSDTSVRPKAKAAYRAQVHIRNHRVTIYSRSGYDWTEQFASLAKAASKLKVRDAIIEGETTVLGNTGLPDFQALRRELGNRDSSKLLLHAFDLLYLNGRDLRRLPLL